MPASVVRARYPDGTVQQMRAVTCSGPLSIQAFRLWERVQTLKRLGSESRESRNRRLDRLAAQYAEEAWNMWRFGAQGKRREAPDA